MRGTPISLSASRNNSPDRLAAILPLAAPVNTLQACRRGELGFNPSSLKWRFVVLSLVPARYFSPYREISRQDPGFCRGISELDFLLVQRDYPSQLDDFQDFRLLSY